MVIGPLVLGSRSGIVDIRRVARLVCLDIVTTADLTRKPGRYKTPRGRVARDSSAAIRSELGPPRPFQGNAPRAQRPARSTSLSTLSIHTHRPFTGHNRRRHYPAIGKTILSRAGG